MVSILREGPKLIRLGTSKTSELAGFLKDNLDGVITDLYNALESGEENNSIVLIMDPGKNVAYLRDVKTVVLIPRSSDTLFSSIINSKGTDFIKDSYICPGTLLMRVVGDFNKILQSIQDTYKSSIMSLEECLDKGTANQTILSFTDKSINQNLSLDELKREHMLVDMETHRLKRKMKPQALRFLNEGLENVDWHDVQIKIYDKNMDYRLHYKRLSLLLDNIDAGLILGEGWGKDYPKFLMSVLIYRVRLFTLWDPVEIKKLLIGLEYLDDGTRIVDLDLYNKNRKTDWPTIIDKNTKKFDRKALGLYYRKQILEKLGDDDKEKLHDYESRILTARD